MESAEPTRKSLRKRIGFALASVMLAVLAMALWQIDDWSRDLTTNYAETSAEAEDPLLRPTFAKANSEEVLESIRDFTRADSLWDVARVDDADKLFQSPIHLTHTTGLLGFTDDVYIELSQRNDGTLIEIRSQSRVGKGDLGQNPRNIRELNSWLREELGVAAQGQR